MSIEQFIVSLPHDPVEFLYELYQVSTNQPKIVGDSRILTESRGIQLLILHIILKLQYLSDSIASIVESVLAYAGVCEYEMATRVIQHFGKQLASFVVVIDKLLGKIDHLQPLVVEQSNLEARSTHDVRLVVAGSATVGYCVSAGFRWIGATIAVGMIACGLHRVWRTTKLNLRRRKHFANQIPKIELVRTHLLRYRDQLLTAQQLHTSLCQTQKTESYQVDAELVASKIRYWRSLSTRCDEDYKRLRKIT